MKILMLASRFMLAYYAPDAELVYAESGDVAPLLDGSIDFAYALQCTEDLLPWLREARDTCRHHGVPTVWHSIEDPNHWAQFAHQAEGFDLIATSDAACIPRYQARFPGSRAIWLPLAAQPAMHYPVAGTPVVDTVLIANWYDGAERIEQVQTLVDPVIEAGMSLALYAYEGFRWPAPYDAFWEGGTNHHEVRNYYPRGRVALGINNQAAGSAMCSMRIFEVLACGRPMVAAHSDAYERLGFVGGEHFIWVREADAARKVRWLLDHPQAAAAMAERGREFVLARHTYARRLETIREALAMLAAG